MTDASDRVRFSKEIHDRYQFGMLCQNRGLLGTAMEIGVHRAVFAGHFLGGWSGAKYIAVDHYLPYFAVENHFPHSDNYRSREVDKQIAHTTLLRFGDRVEWREFDALHALQEQPPGSLDFVYIDGDHVYWSVVQEIGMAWERVKPGGILAGHDFYHGTPDVLRAVNEFAERENVTVWLTQEAWSPWSWYTFKPEAQCPGS